MKHRYLAHKVAALKPSGIRKFFDIVATMDNVISLGIGEPDFDTPDLITKAGIHSLQAGETHYTSNHGTIELRREIALYMLDRYGVSYDPSMEVLVTVGVSEALYLAMTAVINPGDEVLVPSPCFVSYPAEVILAGGVPIEIATHAENGFLPTVESLESSISSRTKAILIGYPNNPTGAVATRQALLDIARIAEENDLVVISDELYDQLIYDTQHVNFASLPGMWDRTILLGGFSKNYAMTGWRIGFACAPADILIGLLRVHQYTIMSAPTTAQAAALVAIRNGASQVEEMRQKYDRRRKLIVSGLNELGLSTFEPHGAFYAFPSIEASGMNEDIFAQKLLEEQRVAVIPGTAFGPGGEGHVRCSYATSYNKIEQALERMSRFMQQYG